MVTDIRQDMKLIVELFVFHLRGPVFGSFFHNEGHICTPFPVIGWILIRETSQHCWMCNHPMLLKGNPFAQIGL